MQRSVAVGQLFPLLPAHSQPARLMLMPENMWVSTYLPLTRRGQLLTALAPQLQLGGLIFILGAAVRLKQDSIHSQAFEQQHILTCYTFVSLILALSTASIFASLSPSESLDSLSPLHVLPLFLVDEPNPRLKKSVNRSDCCQRARVARDEISLPTSRPLAARRAVDRPCQRCFAGEFRELTFD